LQHRIHISGERVTGAVALTSREPVIAAAKALLALGHAPSDMLHVTCPDVTIVPQSIGKLAAPRPKPRQSEIRQMLGMAR
jgi:hypothetical protein